MKKKFLTVATICALFFSYLLPFPQNANAVGEIEIDSCATLKLIGDDEAYPLDEDYILTSDIDCTGEDLTPIGDDENFFSGTLDGNNKTISPVNIHLDMDYQYYGIFSAISGTVKDLNLVVFQIYGIYSTGILAGMLTSTGSIDNVTVSGVENSLISADIAGSLVGISAGSISNSSATISYDIYGQGNSGGLVGKLLGDSAEDPATISNSFTTGSYSGGLANNGGLVGYANQYSNISNSYSSANVDGEWGIGGLVGRSEGTISDSYATGTVTSDWGFGVGGLAGKMYGGEITRSYATGDVIASGDSDFDPQGVFSSYAGGLVGYSTNSGNINKSYASGNVTASGYRVGGFIGGTSGIVSDCYATGNVTSADEEEDSNARRVGGFVGGLTGQISNSYATGSVTGSDDVGGFVGWSDGGQVSNSFSVGSVASDDDSGPFSSYVGGESAFLDDYYFLNNQIIKYPDEITVADAQVSYFYNNINAPLDDWNFSTIWFARNNNYPILAWQSEVEDGPGADSTPPVFSDFTGGTGGINVTEGQSITTNPFIIKVKPTDNVNVEKVEFYVDDNLLCTDTTADEDGIYSCAWDTSQYHSVVKIIAYDTSNNTTQITRNTTVDPTLYNATATPAMTELPRTGKS